MIWRDDDLFLLDMMNIILFPPPEISAVRITEDNNRRITEDGNIRITEGV